MKIIINLSDEAYKEIETLKLINDIKSNKEFIKEAIALYKLLNKEYHKGNEIIIKKGLLKKNKKLTFKEK